MYLKYQFNKLSIDQIFNLRYIARLAQTTKNYKLWRKYWAVKKCYLLEIEIKK